MPMPETKPASVPAAMVRRKQSTHIGPTVAARTKPKARPLAKSAVNIAAIVAVDRKSTRLNSSHLVISYAVFCLKKKKKKKKPDQLKNTYNTEEIYPLLSVYRNKLKEMMLERRTKTPHTVLRN